MFKYLFLIRSDKILKYIYIMENNIFFKGKNAKSNPDVIKNISKKVVERKKNEFQSSKLIYNGITNQIPRDVKNQKDLKLKMDDTLSLIEIKKVMKDKQSERSKQDNDLKPVKIKALPNELIADKHIQNFDELKKTSESHIQKVVQEHTIQKNKYENIMTSLKDLGIFK
jgi:hypothetical protein